MGGSVKHRPKQVSRITRSLERISRRPFDARQPSLHKDFGAGDRIRTCDPRFKSSPRTPQDVSSRLLLYSILRISPPRGTLRHPGLAIQKAIGRRPKSALAEAVEGVVAEEAVATTPDFNSP